MPFDLSSLSKKGKKNFMKLYFKANIVKLFLFFMMMMGTAFFFGHLTDKFIGWLSPDLKQTNILVFINVFVLITVIIAVLFNVCFGKSYLAGSKKFYAKYRCDNKWTFCFECNKELNSNPSVCPFCNADLSVIEIRQLENFELLYLRSAQKNANWAFFFLALSLTVLTAVYYLHFYRNIVANNAERLDKAIQQAAFWEASCRFNTGQGCYYRPVKAGPGVKNHQNIDTLDAMPVLSFLYGEVRFENEPVCKFLHCSTQKQRVEKYCEIFNKRMKKLIDGNADEN